MVEGESEEILGIFPGYNKNFARTKNKLFFTTSRLIVQQEKHLIPLRGDTPGKPEYISTIANARERLKMKQVSAESVLKSNPENFEVLYNNFAAVEIKSARFGAYKCYELLLFSADNLDTPKYDIGLGVGEKYFDYVKEFFHSIWPDKM
ncbi:MAG: hypothetical protein JW840_08925 [Candidatus Thermoplasmatota archaeon]|nr:hypothetical protein [Candidatus Thermoplasmatota archaeon]